MFAQLIFTANRPQSRFLWRLKSIDQPAVDAAELCQGAGVGGVLHVLEAALVVSSAPQEPPSLFVLQGQGLQQRVTSSIRLGVPFQLGADHLNKKQRSSVILLNCPPIRMLYFGDRQSNRKNKP